MNGPQPKIVTKEDAFRTTGWPPLVGGRAYSRYPLSPNVTSIIFVQIDVNPSEPLSSRALAELLKRASSDCAR